MCIIALVVDHECHDDGACCVGGAGERGAEAPQDLAASDCTCSGKLLQLISTLTLVRSLLSNMLQNSTSI